MSYAYRFALPVPAPVLALLVGTIFGALSLLAAAGPCLPDPFGC